MDRQRSGLLEVMENKVQQAGAMNTMQHAVKQHRTFVLDDRAVRMYFAWCNRQGLLLASCAKERRSEHDPAGPVINIPCFAMYAIKTNSSLAT